jgi:hypothetical protein
MEGSSRERRTSLTWVDCKVRQSGIGPRARLEVLRMQTDRLGRGHSHHELIAEHKRICLCGPKVICQTSAEKES